MADELHFVEIDARVIWEEMLEAFEGALSDTLLPSDERRIFLQQQLQLIVGLYNNLNFAGRMTLLRYAYGDFLDAIGEDRGVVRLAATAAGTTLRFSLQSARPGSVVIPAGTRATTAAGDAVFYTTAIASIPPGSLSVTVAAQAVETGYAANGIADGLINVLVDPIAYVYAVSNTTVTAGGADQENDESYRTRIRLSYAQTSTAGAIDSYKYWAATANPDIADIAVASPTPGVVQVVPLMAGGAIPEQEVLDDVAAALSPKEVRPLTDLLRVEAPTESLYAINFDYYAPLADAGTVQQNVEGEGGAIDRYVAWQQAELDRPLNPDYLRSLLFQAGATRITLRTPGYTASAPTTVFHENRAGRTANYIAE